MTLGMTKEKYLEMCEMLGNTPDEDQIPVEFDDLPFEVQEALRIYNQLQDNWDYMGGNYIGKNYVGLFDIMNILGVQPEDRRAVYELLGQIDKIRAASIKKTPKPS